MHYSSMQSVSIIYVSIRIAAPPVMQLLYILIYWAACLQFVCLAYRHQRWRRWRGRSRRRPPAALAVKLGEDDRDPGGERNGNQQRTGAKAQLLRLVIRHDDRCVCTWSKAACEKEGRLERGGGGKGILRHWLNQGNAVCPRALASLPSHARVSEPRAPFPRTHRAGGSGGRKVVGLRPWRTMNRWRRATNRH